jgi:hypothetical protein
MKSKWFKLGIAAFMIGVIGVGAFSAFAQDTTEDPTTRQSPGAIVAEALGMEPADLVAALRDGQTVADLAAENDVELDTIVDAVIADRADELAQAVTDGQITQEEADAMVVLMRGRLTRSFNGSETRGPLGFGHGLFGPDGGRGPGMGHDGGRGGDFGPGRGGRGGHGGPFGQPPVAPEAEATPDADA